MFFASCNVVRLMQLHVFNPTSLGHLKTFVPSTLPIIASWGAQYEYCVSRPECDSIQRIYERLVCESGHE